MQASRPRAAKERGEPGRAASPMATASTAGARRGSARAAAGVAALLFTLLLLLLLPWEHGEHALAQAFVHRTQLCMVLTAGSRHGGGLRGQAKECSGGCEAPENADP